MTVEQLIIWLMGQDPEQIVVIQKDTEGNDFSPLDSMWSGSYRAITTWHGEAGLLELTPELRERGYSEDDVIDGTPALFLVPVN